MSVVLTFDLGTTYFKAALFDERLKLASLARVATPTDSPSPGWGQIDAARFSDAIVQLAAQLRDANPPAWRAVVAVSFATQANSTLLLDDHDQPLTPIVLWNDRRAADHVPWLRERIESADFYARTGIPQYGDGACAGKLRWFSDHAPAAWKSAHKVCLLSDYFTFLLTGEHVSEAGVAGLTGLLDIHTLRWRDGVLAAVGVDHLAWPRVARAGESMGLLRGSLAPKLELPGAVFVVGCLDQYAGAIGTGNVHPGGVSETTGTVLAVVSVSDHFEAGLRARGVYQGPGFRKGLYARMLFSEASANLLEALRNTEAPGRSYDELTALAAKVPAGCDGLRLDVQASIARREPVFEDASRPWSLGHRVRAILEGVAEVLHEQVAALTGEVRPKRIVAAGGAARSQLWLGIKSDRLGMAVEAAAGEEPTSRGAAAVALAAVTSRSVESVVMSS